MEEGPTFSVWLAQIFWQLLCQQRGDDIVHVAIGTCTYDYTLGCTRVCHWFGTESKFYLNRKAECKRGSYGQIHGLVGMRISL